MCLKYILIIINIQHIIPNAESNNVVKHYDKR